jgi:cob(I)alamin adenosyltransferase
MSHPFREGFRLAVGGRSPDFRARPSRTFPARAARQWLRLGAASGGLPGHSGGSVPVSHRLPCPPTMDGAIVSERERPMTVNLTRIYTRLGDGGETHLGDMSRVPNTDPRIEAYGTVDELNAQIGVALAQGGLPDGYDAWLRRIQNDLFDVGADISVPESDERERLRVVPEQTAWLERACDEVNADLPKLRSFVLPGGSAAAAQLHVCRTVCRRAERRTIACGEQINAECVRYLNRLSDLLFILSRGANHAGGGDEPLWEPGAGR